MASQRTFGESFGAARQTYQKTGSGMQSQGAAHTPSSSSQTHPFLSQHFSGQYYAQEGRTTAQAALIERYNQFKSSSSSSSQTYCGPSLGGRPHPGPQKSTSQVEPKRDHGSHSQHASPPPPYYQEETKKYSERGIKKEMPPKKPNTPNSSQNLKKRPVLMPNAGSSLANYMNVPKTATAASTRTSHPLKQVFRFDNDTSGIRTGGGNYQPDEHSYRISSTSNTRVSMETRGYPSDTGPFTPAPLQTSTRGFTEHFMPQTTKNSRTAADHASSHKFQALLQRQGHGSFTGNQRDGRASFSEKNSSGAYQFSQISTPSEGRRPLLPGSSKSAQSTKQTGQQQQRRAPNQPAKGDSGPATPQEGQSSEKIGPTSQSQYHMKQRPNVSRTSERPREQTNQISFMRQTTESTRSSQQAQSSNMGQAGQPHQTYPTQEQQLQQKRGQSRTAQANQKPIPRSKLLIEIPSDDPGAPQGNPLLSPQTQGHQNPLLNTNTQMRVPNSTTNASLTSGSSESAHQKEKSQPPPFNKHPPSIQTENLESNPPTMFKMAQFKSLSTRNSNFDALTLEQQQSLQRQLQQQLQKNSQMAPQIPLQPAQKIIIPNHEPTKCSLKRNGVVRAYAANTNQGLVRNYNEDRVSIILNILKPPSRSNENWPKCSFFGVYDGHGGSACADFLRDNLHQFVIKEASFPWTPKEALRNGFTNAEKTFLQKAQGPNGVIDKSGSCALVVLIVGDMCYVANVGDSRALLSGDGGQRIFPLTRDHKPTDEAERKRIIEAGGQIYQTATATPKNANNPFSKKEIIVGPHRVLPGRLSVCRTFGDVEAKEPRYGGNPNVVIATPQIKSFKITKDHDFIVMSSDGVYDKLTNKESIQCVWNSVRESLAPNIHQQCGLGVEYILKNSLVRRTLDNVTCVIVGFYNLKRKMIVQAEHNCKLKGDIIKPSQGEEMLKHSKEEDGKLWVSYLDEELQGEPMHNEQEEAEETKPQHLQSPLSGVVKAQINSQVPATTSSAAVRRKHFDFSEAAIERYTQKQFDA